MLSRRGFLQAVGGSLLVASPSAAWAQQVKRIGFLRVGPPPQQFITGLRQGLREQGLTEGQNAVIEWGLAESVARLPDALAGLVRLNVDVLVASGTSSVLLTRNLPNNALHLTAGLVFARPAAGECGRYAP